jgi:hypothetical protein
MPTTGTPESLRYRRSFCNILAFVAEFILMLDLPDEPEGWRARRVGRSRQWNWYNYYTTLPEQELQKTLGKPGDGDAILTCDATGRDRLLSFMRNHVYGQPNPPANARPTHGRATTLEHYKKVVSSYVLMYLPEMESWDRRAEEGNISKSCAVNALIADVDKSQAGAGAGVAGGAAPPSVGAWGAGTMHVGGGFVPAGHAWGSGTTAVSAIPATPVGLYLSLKRSVDEMRTNMATQLLEVSRQVKRFHATYVSHINFPVQRQARDNTPSNQRPAVLSKAPANLHVMWTEYIDGINGNKPAGSFTAAERGTCKSTYCRRNHFWKAILAVTNRGHSVEHALALLKEAYGEGHTVSQYLTKIGKDRGQALLVRANVAADVDGAAA